MASILRELTTELNVITTYSNKNVIIYGFNINTDETKIELLRRELNDVAQGI